MPDFSASIPQSMKLKFNFSISNLFLCNKILFDIKSFCYIKYNIFLCNRTFKVQLKFNFILKKQMGSYFIFALVLTVLYIVYYAVNITRDLYGKKGTEKTDEEVFDLGPMDATEESVEVSENETGFKIGNETYGTEAVPAASPAAQNGDTGKKDGTAKDRLERLKAKAEAQMEKVAPYLSDGFTDEEMYKAMISKGRLDNRPSLKWRPVKDKL